MSPTESLRRLAAATGGSLLWTSLLACGSPGEPDIGVPHHGSTGLSPNARPQLVEDLRADDEILRHRSDGQGRAFLVEGPSSIAAGHRGRWHFAFEVGEAGITEGGYVFFQVPPFWGWSSPQLSRPDGPGFSEVVHELDSIQLVSVLLGEGLLGIRVEGRALSEGERIDVIYGTGVAGARADRYAERSSPFWFAVDGDGDGVRGLVASPPTVDVVAAEPARLSLLLPSTTELGRASRLVAAVLDAAGNAGTSFHGVVQLEGGEGLGLPTTVSIEEDGRGMAEVLFTPTIPGVYRLHGRADGIEGTSNPVLVAEGAPTIRWADLHGHSGLSDGTGIPEDYFRYARNVAALDVVALTDHDHWGMKPLARHPEMWAEIQSAVSGANEPGRFVTILGFEWTSWLHGHRHVLYFDATGEVIDSVDPATDSPTELWTRLEGREALTFAHHSAGDPIATNWEIPPHPVLEPVTEIASVHGSSEARDAPLVLARPIEGNFVRDVLDRGHHLGFIGSGDSHDGHPGLAHLSAPSGGLAALFAPDLTREGVLETLRKRLCYATNGPRIILLMNLDGHRMGERVPAESLGERILSSWVLGEGPIEAVDIIRSGETTATVDCAGNLQCRFEVELEPFDSGEYVYLRAVQRDGGAAWSSPIFLE